MYHTTSAHETLGLGDSNPLAQNNGIHVVSADKESVQR